MSAAKDLIANGCEIFPFSVFTGSTFGHQPSGYKCIGFGIETSGPTPDMAAANWLDKFRQRNAKAKNYALS